MIKILTSLTAITASAAMAGAQPLPAPPTEKFTPIEETTCDAKVLQVYFQAGESDLNSASKALLQAAQAQLDGCILGPVSLQASAADAATRGQAETLAEARLDAVATALETYELTGTRLNATYEPSRVEGSLNVPMTRSVEVHLSAWAPHIG